MARFKAAPANKGRLLDRGVWRYTRHPNYFGDATQWWGFYLLAGQPVDRQFLFHAANRIYPPSYVSLEAALKYYGLIPEETFQITSVSTRPSITICSSSA